MGGCKGDAFRIGNGWPSSSRRWCTREKVRYIQKYQKTVPGCIPCIGYAADEMHRMKLGPQRYPLIEYCITEKQAIEYCRKLGYTWGGLYDLFDRVSCWCCPLQSLDDLRTLRKHRPEHASPSMTLSVYQHTSTALRIDAVSRLHNPLIGNQLPEGTKNIPNKSKG